MTSLTPRERSEQIERQTLSPRAQFADATKGREREEPQDALRTVYQRDRDRIVHAKAFRRLKHKTQVFLAPEGDHYRVGSRTRWTSRRSPAPWPARSG